MNNLLARLQQKLHPKPVWDHEQRSDYDLNPDMAPLPGAEGPLREAAVLVPIVAHDRPTILFTQRAEDLPSHPGQVSFPGGKVAELDQGPADTALRETEEEVGIGRSLVTIAGYLDPYETRTGYCIVPVVGIVRPPFDLVVDRGEVVDVFEVPWAFLMDPDNHQTHGREWQGVMRYFYAMPYNDHYIWGATAGMVKALYDKVGDQ